MKPEFLDRKASQCTDEQIFICLNETVYNSLRILSLQSKPEHARIVIEGILPIIRNRFNNFTMNQLDSAIKSGSYGEFGDYTKMNPKTIMDWFNKKRVEISVNNERFSKDEKRASEDVIIPCKNGGEAVMLGLFYHERGFRLPTSQEMSFNERLELIESGKPCPFTGGNIKSIIQNYNPTDLFKMNFN